MVIKLETKREPLMNTIKLTQTHELTELPQITMGQTKGRNNLKS